MKFLAIWRRLASVASFASRATNLFTSSRLASATKIVRPLKSTVAMQPQLQPGIAEIVSDDLPRLHARSVLRSFQSATNGWLCWRRISSSNYDAPAGWLLYAVDCLRNEDQATIRKSKTQATFSTIRFGSVIAIFAERCRKLFAKLRSAVSVEQTW